jgi:hypothetical protein
MEENRYKPPSAPVEDVGLQAPSLERPQVVRYGAWILWLQAAIGLPGVVYGIVRPPAEAAAGIAYVAFMFGMVIAIGFVALFAWFTWMALKGRNWARIVHLVFMLLGLLFTYWVVRMAFAQSTYDGVISIIQAVLYPAGVILLFLPAANRWYRALREARG